MFANQIMEKTWSHQNPGYSSIFLDNTLENEHGMMNITGFGQEWIIFQTFTINVSCWFSVVYSIHPLQGLTPKNPSTHRHHQPTHAYELCQHNFHPWQVGAEKKQRFSKKWGQTKVSQLCIYQTSFKPESSNIIFVLFNECFNETSNNFHQFVTVIYVQCEMFTCLFFSMFPHMLSCFILVGFFLSQQKIPTTKTRRNLRTSQVPKIYRAGRLHGETWGV